MKGGVYRILTYSLCHIDFFHDSSFLGLMTFISCVLRNTYTVFPFSLTLLGRLFHISPQLKIHKLAATSNKKDLLMRSRRLDIAI